MDYIIITIVIIIATIFYLIGTRCKTKMRLDRLWLLLSVAVLVVMAVVAIGRAKKDHQHFLMRKLITGGKRSGKKMFLS